MPDRRFEGTKIGPDGRRVPADDLDDTASSVRSTKIDPSTQIAADGSRQSTEDIDPNATAVRTAEADVRAERAEHVAGSEKPPANGTGISNDVETTGSSENSGDLESKTKDELYEMATDLDIEGRSTMNKDELLDAVKAAQK